jgi:hypothetical protein
MLFLPKNTSIDEIVSKLLTYHSYFSNTMAATEDIHEHKELILEV